MAERAVESPSVALARRAFFVLASIGLVVAALYLGRNIFVPLSLALLLTLLLGPVVGHLERRGFGRLPAVLSAALLAFFFIGLLGWAVAAQFATLLDDLPRHRADLKAKMGSQGGLRALMGLLGEAEQPGGAQVEPVKPSALTQLQPVLGRALGAVSLIPPVVLLVITLLLYREDTRNRLIRMAGRGRLAVTTRALDETARRIGGYLLGHATVNVGFGAAIGLGLFLLGVPYPVLWSLLAAAFRFIPSIGVWLVAPLPAALAYVGGTASPLAVLAMFLALELLTANVIEPRVCGRSVGLAPVPLFLALTFWTGLWGVVGLVLATPLTVCLAVLGKHIRSLGFLAVLLGKEATLRPAVRYYQRLLARDQDEAEAVVREYLAEHPAEGLFDRVLLPALVLVRRGRKGGELGADDEEYILRTTREIVDGLAPKADGAQPDPTGEVAVLAVPAVGGADEVALAMLAHLARTTGIGVTVAGGLPTSGEGRIGSNLAEAAVVVAVVRPGGLTEARYLCRRLREQYPRVKVVVGWWGSGKDAQKARDFLLAAGADQVAVTLREACIQVMRLAHTPRPTPDPTSFTC